jgi:hypothetical protein
MSVALVLLDYGANLAGWKRSEGCGAVIELVLSEKCEYPTVACLPGPRIVLTMNVTAEISKVLQFCRDDLQRAITWAMFNMYQGENVPARVYHRDIHGEAMSIFVDPCELFGSDAFVRPKNLERLQNFSGGSI